MGEPPITTSNGRATNNHTEQASKIHYWRMIALLFFWLDIEPVLTVLYFLLWLTQTCWFLLSILIFFLLHKCPSASLFIIHGFLSTFERYELFRTTQY